MNNNNPNIIFNPLISAIQKVVLYETKTVSTQLRRLLNIIF